MSVTSANGSGYRGRAYQLTAPTESVEAEDGTVEDWLAAQFMEILPELINIDPFLPPGIGRVKWVSREELKKLYPTASD